MTWNWKGAGRASKAEPPVSWVLRAWRRSDGINWQTEYRQQEDKVEVKKEKPQGGA